jgi:hypothetical protein
MHRMIHRKAAGFSVGGISYSSSEHTQVGTDAYRPTDYEGTMLVSFYSHSLFLLLSSSSARHKVGLPWSSQLACEGWNLKLWCLGCRDQDRTVAVPVGMA